MNFKEELEKYTFAAERAIEKYLPAEDPAANNKTLTDSMRYSVMNGGKRLRPVLMLACYRLCGGEDEPFVEPFMAALEMIHSYSLVHDDLPEMDNDELRRGKPTTHVKYGHAMAVLAGDGLLNLSYETLLHACIHADVSKRAAALKASALLAKCAGMYGMVGGQSLDVEAEKNNIALNDEQLMYVYENKTAKLLMAAMGCGALLAGNEAALPAVREAAYKLGIAFQIKDDILDITSTTEQLGKPVGSDERNDKKTYVACRGMETAEAELKSLSEEAAQLISGIKTESEDAAAAQKFLLALIDHLTVRSF